MSSLPCAAAELRYWKSLAFWRGCLRLSPRLWIASALLLLSGGCGSGGDLPLFAPSQAPQAVDPFAPHEAAVRQVMTTYHAPGVVVGVWLPGKQPWLKALGVRNVTTREPMTTADHFPIASITKSFTVNLILQLNDQLRLNLNDTVDKYLPNIPYGNRITLLQLAAMESGIKNYTATQGFLDKFTQDYAATFTEQELVNDAIPESPLFEPGTQYDYSNTNTVMLGMIVQQVTGQSLAQAMQQYIFSKLSLIETSYPDQAVLPVPHPQPYDVDKVSGTITELPFIDPSSMAGSGAMVSTINDLGIWGKALGSGQLLNFITFGTQTNHTNTPLSGPRYDSYGLGIGKLKGWLGHTGSGMGFQAATFYNPISHATIAVLVNARPSQAGGGNVLSPNFDDNIAQAIFEALANVVASQ